MHPPAISSLTGSSAGGPRLSRAVRSAAAAHASHKPTDPTTPAAATATWITYCSRLRVLRALLACQPSSSELPATAEQCGRNGLMRGLYGQGTMLRYASGTTRRSALIGLASAAASSSPWWSPRRHASAGRRPTFLEVNEALDVLGVTIDEDAKSLKKKYRELVKKNHPDAGGDAAVMSKVTVAYDRLSTLTNREKEEYKVQKKMYHAGGGSGGVSGSRRYRPGPPGGYGYAAPNGPFNARAANMYGQYYQQDANTAYQQSQSGGQQSYWNQFHNRTGSSGFADNPFNFSNPFSMSAQAQRARMMPTGTLLIQGLVIYLVFSAFFLFVYRRYRDWRHDDGWRMSESLARHEQMQEMHRMRQEMNERARAMLMRDGGSGSGGGGAGADPSALLPGAGGLFGARQYVGESPEARALEYARQRRIQMMQEQQEAAANAPELRGWPKVDDDKGRIIKRAQDPPGVVFFEPRKEDMRRRQIENQRRASGFTRRSADTTTPTPPAAAVASPAESAQAAAAAVAAGSRGGGNSGSAGASASGSHPLLPPETNVSSIVMKPVGSDQEAQAVMQGIFSGLRRNAS